MPTNMMDRPGTRAVASALGMVIWLAFALGRPAVTKADEGGAAGGTVAAEIAAGGQDTGAATQSTGPAPNIDLPEPVFDAGTVADGTKIVHVFTVRNTGDADLHIKDTKAG